MLAAGVYIVDGWWVGGVCDGAEVIAGEVVAEVVVVGEGVGAVGAGSKGAVVAEVELSACETYWAGYWIRVVEVGWAWLWSADSCMCSSGG